MYKIKKYTYNILTMCIIHTIMKEVGGGIVCQ